MDIKDFDPNGFKIEFRNNKGEVTQTFGGENDAPMPEIEVIKKTVQDIGGIANYYGGLLAAKTECGGYAWTIEDYDGESWQLIPESIYLELVKFNSAPIQIGEIGCEL